jgi:hypothetical protein
MNRLALLWATIALLGGCQTATMPRGVGDGRRLGPPPWLDQTPATDRVWNGWRETGSEPIQCNVGNAGSALVCRITLASASRRHFSRSKA